MFWFFFLFCFVLFFAETGILVSGFLWRSKYVGVGLGCGYIYAGVGVRVCDVVMFIMCVFTCVRQKTPASSVTSPKPATNDHNRSPILMMQTVCNSTVLTVCVTSAGSEFFLVLQLYSASSIDQGQYHSQMYIVVLMFVICVFPINVTYLQLVKNSRNHHTRPYLFCCDHIWCVIMVIAFSVRNDSELHTVSRVW